MVAFPAEKIPNETKKSIFSPGIGCSTGWELIVPLKKIKIKKGDLSSIGKLYSSVNLSHKNIKI